MTKMQIQQFVIQDDEKEPESDLEQLRAEVMILKKELAEEKKKNQKIIKENERLKTKVSYINHQLQQHHQHAGNHKDVK